MKKSSTAVWMVVMLAGFFAVAGGIGFIKYRQIRSGMAANANFAPPAETVTSTVAREEVWPHQIEAPGSLRAFQGVMLSAESSGKVVEIGFNSGEKVEQRRMLIKLDASVEEAELKAAVARAEFAALNQDRIQELRTTGALSQREIEDVDSQFKQSRADVERLRAEIDRKTIKASFAGRTGIRQVQIGQYLTSGTPVVSLHTLDPIYVNFSVPQQDVARIKTDQEIRVVVDAFPDEIFKGRVTAIDPQLDETMRSIGIQATLSNPDEKLRPGMFGHVSLVLSEEAAYVTVPATSIARAPYGDSVYVVEKMKDSKNREYLGVKQQFVKTGRRRGEQVGLVSGIAPGQEVVTSGLFKLRPGSAVRVNNDVQPGNQPVVHPPDN